MSSTFKLYLFFSLVMLTGVVATLAHSINERGRNLHTEQVLIADNAVKSSAALIEQQVRVLERSVILFASAFREEIVELALNPDDDELEARLLKKIKHYIPESFTYTIADEVGNTVLVDFDGFVGGLCNISMSEFSKNHRNDSLFIHPAAEYHFDIMTDWSGAGKKGLFFISFNAGLLSKYLTQSPGHSMYVIKKGDKNLIELTVNGSRDNMRRDNFLSESEIENIIAKQDVHNTQWWVADIHNPGIVQKDIKIAQLYALIVFAVFVCFTLVGLWVLYKEESRRQAAQRALEKNEKDLQSIVDEKTNDLKKANKELEKLSISDALTGIGNRRMFDTEIAREYGRSCRHNDTISMMMCDIDHFKKYNDTYGHVAGDACLVRVARAIDNEFNRIGDVVVRYGGEEFAIVFHGIEQNRMREQAEKLRGVIEGLKIKHETSGVSEYVTMSIGCAVMKAEAKKPVDNLIKLADSALYEAKSNGRNRIECHREITLEDTRVKKHL